jgi:hypothetical protein
MKFRISRLVLFLSGFVLIFLDVKSAKRWRPDDRAAVFTVNPNQVLGSPYFNEVLSTYGLIGFAYSALMNDHHVMDLQKEMGVKIEDVSEISFVIGNFLETIINTPVSTSGNYDALTYSSLILIVRTKAEVSPETIFEKFDRWASGPAFHSSEIDRFSKDRRIETEKIEEMSKARRIKREVYAGLEKSEKVGKTTLFTIPASAYGEVFANQGINQQKIFVGIQAEKDTTIFAFGSKDRVLAFFAHENKSMHSKNNSGNEEFTSFSIPLDGEMLKKMEASKLSDPNGPLGPLATTLGEAMYQIKEISGETKFSGGWAHLDLVISCKDVQSAQSIWSVGQASLGMAQLNIVRKKLKDPTAQTAVSLDFLNRIKLKHQEADVLVHVEASPAELIPWATNKKFP